MAFGKKKSLMDQAQDYVDQVSETVRPQLEAAIGSASEKAGPALADARDRAKPLLAEGKLVATEKAAAGASYAAEKASIGAALAAEKAAAGAEIAAAKLTEAKDALEPEPESKKGGKLKKVLFLGALIAAAGVVASKLKGKKESANWQSSYVPTPAATPTPAPPAPTEAAEKAPDDNAGGAPGEALSDAVEEPQDVTTPDSPAEVIDVDDTENRS